MAIFTASLFILPAQPMISLLVGVIVAVILAILAYPLWSIGVIAVGAALGFMILGELGLALNFPENRSQFSWVCWVP